MTHSIPCHARKLRYTASAMASSQRCHGSDDARRGLVASSVATAAWAWPPSTVRPHVGQVPSARTDGGDRNRSQVAHQGTTPVSRPAITRAERRGDAGTPRRGGGAPARAGRPAPRRDADAGGRVPQIDAGFVPVPPLGDVRSPLLGILDGLDL